MVIVVYRWLTTSGVMVTYTKFECRHDGSGLTQSTVDMKEVFAAMKKDLEVYERLGFPLKQMEPMIKPVLKIIRTRDDIHDLVIPLAQRLTDDIEKAILATPPRRTLSLDEAFKGETAPIEPKRISTNASFQSTSAPPLISWSAVWLEFAEGLSHIGLLTSVINILITYTFLAIFAKMGMIVNDNTTEAVKAALMVTVFFEIKDTHIVSYILEERHRIGRVGQGGNILWKVLSGTAKEITSKAGLAKYSTDYAIYLLFRDYYFNMQIVGAGKDQVAKIMNAIITLPNFLLPGTDYDFTKWTENTASSVTLFGGLVLAYRFLPTVVKQIHKSVQFSLKRYPKVELAVSAAGLTTALTAAMYGLERAYPIVTMTAEGKSVVFGMPVPQDNYEFYTHVLKEASTLQRTEGPKEFVNYHAKSTITPPPGVDEDEFYLKLKKKALALADQFLRSEYSAQITDRMGRQGILPQLGESTTFYPIDPKVAFDSTNRLSASLQDYIKVFGADMNLANVPSGLRKKAFELCELNDAFVRYILPASGVILIGFILKKTYWDSYKLDSDRPSSERFLAGRDTELWIETKTQLNAAIFPALSTVGTAFLFDPIFADFERRQFDLREPTVNIQNHIICMNILRRAAVVSALYYMFSYLGDRSGENKVIMIKDKQLFRGVGIDQASRELSRSSALPMALWVFLLSMYAIQFKMALDRTTLHEEATSASFRDRTTSSK